MISRSLTAYVWYQIDVRLADWAEKQGFFWFEAKFSSYRHEEEKIDKSGDILGWLVLIFFAILIGEVAIRLASWTSPPYLSPPGS